jgi:hypothetical protein
LKNVLKNCEGRFFGFLKTVFNTNTKSKTDTVKPFQHWFTLGMERFNRNLKNDLKNVLKNREERFRFLETVFNTKSETDYG